MAKYNKTDSEFVRNLKITKPNDMQYYVSTKTDNDQRKLIKRIKKIVRSSKEYKDYIGYLKENVGLDSCIFFQKVTQNKNISGGRRGKISIEIHHEPFTMEDICQVILKKYIEEGIPINDLLIADEVMELHYANKVGLVPLSKTAHEMVHKSSKLFVPMNMIYGNYQEFIDEYEKYIDKIPGLYDKVKQKIDMTKSLTPESFDALTKAFTYIQVDGYEDIEKIPIDVEGQEVG